MREDMFKVIVERPRLVNSNGYSKDGRRFRNDEDRPAKLGMRRGYGCPKWFNENLAPLQRYLEKQVNRPWDKVYSEIRATIDARSTVKRHILQHIDDFVAIDTHWVETPKGGKVVVRGEGWPVKDRSLEEARVELYVHPRTGILLRNRRYVSWDARKRKEREVERERVSAIRCDIDDDLQLRCIDGIWYEVTLGKLPVPKLQVKEVDGEWQEKKTYESCWDVVRKEWVSRKHGILPTAKSQPSNRDMYGNPDAYAVSKRQFNSRELKEHGLGVNNFSQGRSS